jgi:hypothetical protein
VIWQTIDIDGYWLATVVYVPLEQDMPAVAEAMTRLGCPQEDIGKTWHLMTEEWNRGYTWSNPARRRSITLIGRAWNWEQFFNTVMHETKHLVDEITAAYDVMNYGEPPAYLQGFLGQRMAPAIRRIVCPCCGKEKEI